MSITKQGDVMIESSQHGRTFFNFKQHNARCPRLNIIGLVLLRCCRLQKTLRSITLSCRAAFNSFFLRRFASLVCRWFTLICCGKSSRCCRVSNSVFSTCHADPGWPLLSGERPICLDGFSALWKRSLFRWPMLQKTVPEVETAPVQPPQKWIFPQNNTCFIYFYLSSFQVTNFQNLLAYGFLNKWFISFNAWLPIFVPHPSRTLPVSLPRLRRRGVAELFGQDLGLRGGGKVAGTSGEVRSDEFVGRWEVGSCWKLGMAMSCP